jgi:hypothetical protein
MDDVARSEFYQPDGSFILNEFEVPEAEDHVSCSLSPQPHGRNGSGLMPNRHITFPALQFWKRDMA